MADGGTAAGRGGSSGGGGGPGAGGLEAGSRRGRFGSMRSRSVVLVSGRRASPRRRRRLGKRAREAMRGRDVEPFFHELVRGEEVDDEIGDREDVPELQSGFFCFTVAV